MTTVNNHKPARQKWWVWECSCGKAYRFFMAEARWRTHIFETVEQYL